MYVYRKKEVDFSLRNREATLILEVKTECFRERQYWIQSPH